VTTARITEEVQVARAVGAVIVAVAFPEVVVVVLGVAVAGAEEFMGDSKVRVARACDAVGMMKGFRALVQNVRGVATRQNLKLSVAPKSGTVLGPCPS
jgi:hypothetical protein